MDEQGIYRNTEEDWNTLARLLNECGNLVFPYASGPFGFMVISINESFFPSGAFGIAGNPTARILVGIIGYGMNHLTWEEASNHYVLRHKLQISGEDAEGLSKLFYEISRRLV